MKSEARKNFHFFQQKTTKVGNPFPKKALLSCIAAIAHEFSILNRSQVNVIFCSDYRIRQLNRTFRKIDKPTDVLSFTFDDDDFLGEIYISIQRAVVQSRRFETTYTDEMRRLLVHGIFHLLGFDHIKKKDRHVMELCEQRILNKNKKGVMV